MSDTATLSRLFSSIEGDLALVDQVFRERAFSDFPMLQDASAFVVDTPGKRMRTALTLLSGRLISYKSEVLIPLSVAFEMTHLATLLHDDIIDHAQTRRGLPTVNSRYGDAVAILLGDFLFARTAGLVAELENSRLDQLFAETVTRVCEGTIVELMTAHKLNVTMNQYLDRIERKTACLMAACCKGAALAVSGTPDQVEALFRYGLNLGIAFQIVDDVLDYTGAESSIGKPTGNDLRQGLVTLPLIYALQVEQNGRLPWLEGIVTAPEQHETEISDVVRWVAEGDGIARARELASRYAADARGALDALPDNEVRDLLADLVDFVLTRTH
ncbi:MAG TPA: polyprenyl synthetase family protein [Ktedonobacterales bacterium]